MNADQAAEEIENLVRRLANPNSSERKAIWKAIEQFGPPAADSLAAALSDRHAYVRKSAAYGLGRIHSPNSVWPLIPLLKDQAVGVRKMAAWALGRIGRGEAAPALMAALSDGNSRVRSEVAASLGKIGARRAAVALIGALGDDERRVRAVAAKSLGQIGDVSAAAPLCRAVDDREPTVRISAARSLGQLANRPDAPVVLRSALPSLRRQRRYGRIVGGYEVFDLAIRRIEGATDSVRATPMPAAPPSADRSDLPRPARAGSVPADNRLPLPADCGTTPFKEQAAGAWQRFLRRFNR